MGQVQTSLRFAYVQARGCSTPVTTLHRGLLGARKNDSMVRIPAALVEDLGLLAGTHDGSRASVTPVPKDSMPPLLASLGTALVWHTHSHTYM